jgi:phage terminase Nu1 subunit (DNA packaging protein)
MAAYARLKGVTRAAVTGWRRRGYVVMTPGGKVDVVATDARLAARPSLNRKVGKQEPGAAAVGGAPEQSSAAGDPAGWSRQEALRQREIAQAQLARIEADTAAGLVVPKAEVVGVVRAEYTVVRTALLGMASKLAHRLAAATTPEACGALVDAEVRGLLEALTADGGAK